jgi:hypothetical protein
MVSATVLAVALMSACTAGSSPEARTDDPPGQKFSTSRPGEEYVVPEIADPLDLRKFAVDSCGIISVEHASKLDIHDPALAGGNTCKFSAGPQNGNAEIYVGVRLGRGLASTYELYLEIGSRQGFDASWEPVALANYPAAHMNGDLDRKYGRCTLLVGVADDQILRVEAGAAVHRPDEKANTVDWPACEHARAVARAVISGLREES